MLTFINTRLRGIHTIKAFNKYSPEEKRYRKRSEELLEIGKQYQKVASSIQSVIPALTYLMLGILMWYVYYLKSFNDKNEVRLTCIDDKALALGTAGMKNANETIQLSDKIEWATTMIPRIGSNAKGDGNFFKGSIDEIGLVRNNVTDEALLQAFNTILIP